MSKKTEETRQKIVLSAKKLFLQQGFKGTSTKQIAEGAGISEMTFFRHFPTKEQVFNAVVQPLIDFLDNLRFEETDNFRSQLKELLQDRLSFLCDERDLVRFVIMEGYMVPGGFNPAAEAAEKIRLLLEPVQESKRELYLRVIMGYVLTWIFLPDNCKDGPLLDDLVDLLE